MIDLKEFIEKTLVNVLAGVSSAQQDVNFGQNISPSKIGDLVFPPEANIFHLVHMGCFTTVKFDIAVTAEEASSAQGGGGLKVAVVSLGAEGKTSLSNTSVTRIQFAVPVLLPAVD